METLSEHDLRCVLQAIEEWSKLMVTDSGEWSKLAEPVLSIKLCNPEHGEHIGDLILEDGWLGFAPVERN